MPVSGPASAGTSLRAWIPLPRAPVTSGAELTPSERRRLPGFGPDLPGNIAYADQRAAQFRHAVDEYVARAGFIAPPPDTDPAERPQAEPAKPRKHPACRQNGSPP